MTNQTGEELDLSKMSQSELLRIAEQGAAYDTIAMYAALESAPGMEHLSVDDHVYRDEFMEFLLFQVALSMVVEYTDEHGLGTFTVKKMVDWAMENTEDTLKLEGIFDEETIRAEYVAEIERQVAILLEADTIVIVREGVYKPCDGFGARLQ